MNLNVLIKKYEKSKEKSLNKKQVKEHFFPDNLKIKFPKEKQLINECIIHLIIHT